MDPRQQTLRVSGLPPLTQEGDVRQFFEDRITRKHGRNIVESVGPICDHANRQTKRTTVSFSSHNAAVKALELLPKERRFSAERGGVETITLDHAFKDLTTLHSKNNPAAGKGKPDVDIVVVHGLTGHAWNSFTTSEVYDQSGGRTKETTWLRDILPRLLEHDQRQSIYARILSYGYNADVWMTDSVADIDVPVNNLLTYLESERGSDPRRPLFFMGHSLGGIVIKQAIVELANTAIGKSTATEEYNFPVKGCMFFGVPNRGTERADTASSILKVLNTVFSVNRNVVRDLEYKSQRLANISMEFRTIRHTHSIPVISFFETVRYNYALGLIVDKESAVITYEGCPRPFGIDRNHKEMARFADDDAHALEPAIQFLAQLAQQATAEQVSRSRPRPRLPTLPAIVGGNVPGTESLWSNLGRYDTCFLIDDSPSMADKWDLVKAILDYSTEIATRYDPNGIDIHFFNNLAANMDNVRDPVMAKQIHNNIVLQGSTPLLDQLSSHLDHYLLEYEEHRRDLNFRKYNLIILTDGEPDPEDEDPGDVSDQEDARKYSGVYRLIRKKIVETARELDTLRAQPNQLAIQFCQIGNEDGVQDFFEYLDNNLKAKWKLKRDMVDTIRCLSWDDLQHPQFYEKLLMSFNQMFDHIDLSHAPERPPVQPHPVHPAPHQREHDQLSSLAHRPSARENGKMPAQPYNDHGEGPSAGHSISNPETTTQQSLTAAQYGYYSNDGQYSTHNTYTTSPTEGRIPPRVPSPRTLSHGPYPVSTPDVPELGVNRAATDRVGGFRKTKRFSWRRGS